MSVRLALIGDVHGCWDAADVAAIDARGYDLVLFTGDLPGTSHRDLLPVARRIAGLRTPAVLVPGNHDGTSPLGVLAEALGWPRRRPGTGRRHLRRLAALEEALHPVRLGGYSLHPLGGLTLIVGRPHAMDGAQLCFADGLAARWQVADLATSSARLCQLVDDAPTERIVFLVHNGPAGLGSDAGAPFALRDGRDLGDRDLADALAHARRVGKHVVAVLAGHLHHGRGRRWRVRRDGTLVVNAARVPRIFEQGGRTWRHHVEVRIDGAEAQAEEVLLAG